MDFLTHKTYLYYLFIYSFISPSIVIDQFQIEDTMQDKNTQLKNLAVNLKQNEKQKKSNNIQKYSNT